MGAALASLCWLLFIGGLLLICVGWALWKLGDWLIERFL